MCLKEGQAGLDALLSMRISSVRLALIGVSSGIQLRLLLQEGKVLAATLLFNSSCHAVFSYCIKLPCGIQSSSLMSLRPTVVILSHALDGYVLHASAMMSGFWCFQILGAKGI